MKTFINSWVFASLFAITTLGSVGMYAWHVAYVLHTTGSELIKLFIGG